jgi:hypothetical protein
MKAYSFPNLKLDSDTKNTPHGAIIVTSSFIESEGGIWKDYIFLDRRRRNFSIVFNGAQF